MNSAESEIRVLRVEVDNLKDSFRRFISHLESEQRVYGNHGQQIDRLQKAVDKFDLILLNTGKGLTFEVDRLKQREGSVRNGWQTAISVISILISLGTLISMYLI